MQARAISTPYDFPDALVVGILISLHRNNLGWYCSQSHSILFEGCGVFADLIFGSEMQTVAFVNVSSNRIARGCNQYGHKVGPSSSTNSVCSQVQFLRALATFHYTSSQPSRSSRTDSSSEAAKLTLASALEWCSSSVLLPGLGLD